MSINWHGRPESAWMSASYVIKLCGKTIAGMNYEATLYIFLWIAVVLQIVYKFNNFPEILYN